MILEGRKRGIAQKAKALRVKMRINLTSDLGSTDYGVRLQNCATEVIGGRRRGEDISNHIPTG